MLASLAGAKLRRMDGTRAERVHATLGGLEAPQQRLRECHEWPDGQLNNLNPHNKLTAREMKEKLLWKDDDEEEQAQAQAQVQRDEQHERKVDGLQRQMHSEATRKSEAVHAQQPRLKELALGPSQRKKGQG